MSRFELQELEANVIVQAFNSESGMQAIIDQIKAQVGSVVSDVTTAKGRKEIASLAYKVAQSKSAIDAEGKKLKEQYTVITSKIDADRKLARDQLDAERDRIRQPLTDWENAEKERVAKHEEAIQFIKNHAPTADATALKLKGDIEFLENLSIGPQYEEYEERAKLAKYETLESLRRILDDRIQYEAEQEELERLRIAEAERVQRERDERIAREAAEQATREAEAKAQAEAERVQREKLESEQREARLQAEKEAAELREQALKQKAIEDAKQAEIEKQRAIEAEAARIKAEAEAQAKAEAEEQAKREANLAHRKRISTEALKGLTDLGIDIEIAKAVLKAINEQKVPHVSIKF